MGTQPGGETHFLIFLCFLPILAAIVVPLGGRLAVRAGWTTRERSRQATFLADLASIPAAYMAALLFATVGAWFAVAGLILGGTLTAYPYARWAWRRRKARRGVVA